MTTDDNDTKPAMSDEDIMTLAQKSHFYASAFLGVLAEREEDGAVILMVAAQLAARAVHNAKDLTAGRELLIGGMDAALRDLKQISVEDDGQTQH